MQEKEKKWKQDHQVKDFCQTVKRRRLAGTVSFFIGLKWKVYQCWRWRCVCVCVSVGGGGVPEGNAGGE